MNKVSDSCCLSIFNYLKCKSPISPSNTQIQKDTGYGTASISKALKRLSDENFITIRRTSKNDKTRVIHINHEFQTIQRPAESSEQICQNSQEE